MTDPGRTTRSALLTLAALGLLTSACNPTPSSGRFQSDALSYGNCAEDIMPWEPSFYTIDRFEDQLTIRLQSRDGGIQSLDGIFIQVRQSHVAENVRKDLLLGMPSVSGSLDARAILGFYDSCPRANVVPELVGWIRFDFFQPRNDGQITGTIQAPVVVDSRTGDIIGENFTGSFSFIVQKGRPYTNFTGPGQE